MKATWAGLVGTLVVVLAQVAEGGRPLVIDDAYPVDKGAFELEAGVGFHRDGDMDHWDFPIGLTYGLVDRVEVGVGFGWQMEERRHVVDGDERASSFGDLTLGVKWQFAEQANLWADQALAAVLTLPTSDEDEGFGSGEIDFDIMWIASRRISDELAVHVNLGYTFVGDPEGEELDDTVHYGIAAEYQIAPRWQVVAEVFADTPTSDIDDTVAAINGGVRWEALDSLILDAAIGTTIHGDGPDVFVTVGLTWGF